MSETSRSGNEWAIFREAHNLEQDTGPLSTQELMRQLVEAVVDKTDESIPEYLHAGAQRVDLRIPPGTVLQEVNVGWHKATQRQDRLLVDMSVAVKPGQKITDKTDGSFFVFIYSPDFTLDARFPAHRLINSHEYKVVIKRLVDNGRKIIDTTLDYSPQELQELLSQLTAVVEQYGVERSYAAPYTDVDTDKLFGDTSDVSDFAAVESQVADLYRPDKIDQAQLVDQFTRHQEMLARDLQRLITNSGQTADKDALLLVAAIVEDAIDRQRLFDVNGEYRLELGSRRRELESIEVGYDDIASIHNVWEIKDQPKINEPLNRNMIEEFYDDQPQLRRVLKQLQPLLFPEGKPKIDNDGRVIHQWWEYVAAYTGMALRVAQANDH